MVRKGRRHTAAKIAQDERCCVQDLFKVSLFKPYKLINKMKIYLGLHNREVT